MDEFEKARRFLGKGDYLELETEGETFKFYIRLLNLEERIDFLQILRQVTDYNKPIFMQLDKETAILANDLAYKSVKDSPELAGLTEPERHQFAEDNVLPIVQKMLEINNYGAARISIPREVLERAKEMQKIRDKHAKP